MKVGGAVGVVGAALFAFLIALQGQEVSNVFGGISQSPTYDPNEMMNVDMNAIDVPDPNVRH